MSKTYEMLGPGSFTADQVKPGSRYELVDGHPVLCAPTGRRGSVANLGGGMVIATDPDVESAGVDLGVSRAPRQLRAPDVAVLAKDEPADAPGWAERAPPLAVEYADTGQDEHELQARISELLAAGTRFVWVVRLDGIRRVEVHQADEAPRLLTLGQELEAPGILRNPVPVEALYFHDAAQRVALRNLLQRQGFEDLEAVLAQGRDEGREQGRDEGREEGKTQGLREALLTVLRARGLAPDDEALDRIERADADTLRRWLGLAGQVDALSALLER
ncbi:MAG: Uma2 family endonuclease [Alphaproteobacteria bacterium]|nr:Uma2 family endonuclease [Alphaproteobacteria bacterium]MCB9792328.1 Uma2 family endonuclease [Alphaproteobacteria bacterium]